jgi:outer membrane protein assembly factor BamD (BamD/ComL family)
MKRTLLLVPLAAALALAVSGCQSVPDPASISTDKTVAELSQDGQSALDDNNYRAAEVYYQLIIDRYGDDIGAKTAAEFEIAHIRLKKKAWNDAAARLDAIIARYDAEGGAGLPPEYLVLAKNDRARIPSSAKK